MQAKKDQTAEVHLGNSDLHIAELLHRLCEMRLSPKQVETVSVSRSSVLLPLARPYVLADSVMAPAPEFPLERAALRYDTIHSTEQLTRGDSTAFGGSGLFFFSSSVLIANAIEDAICSGRCLPRRDDEPYFLQAIW